VPRGSNSGPLPLSLPVCLSTCTVFFLSIHTLFALLLSVFVGILLPRGSMHILLTFISGLILSELECTEELKPDHVSRGTVPEILLSRICILLIKGCYSMV